MAGADYLHGRNGDFVVKEPMALGHEAAGEIVAVGKGVQGFAVGDRVAIEAGQYCSSCHLCKQGRYNLCPNLRFASSAKTFPHLDGTLQSHMNFPVAVSPSAYALIFNKLKKARVQVKYLHKMAPSISYEQGSLVEPLSVCLQAAKQSKLRAGQNVLVLGTGAVGLLMCAVAKAAGASRICTADIAQDRVDFAVKESFATAGTTLERKTHPENNQIALEQSKATSLHLTAEFQQTSGFDVVYECTGVASCIQAAIYSAASGGCVCCVGMGSPNVFLPLGAAALREVDIVGVFRYCNTYPAALDMISAGRLPNIEKLVTHRFPLTETKVAFEALAAGKAADGKPVMKIMIGDY